MRLHLNQGIPTRPAETQSQLHIADSQLTARTPAMLRSDSGTTRFVLRIQARAARTNAQAAQCRIDPIGPFVVQHGSPRMGDQNEWQRIVDSEDSSLLRRLSQIKIRPVESPINRVQPLLLTSCRRTRFAPSFLPRKALTRSAVCGKFANTTIAGV